jgi:xanthine dehydrogenase accessory factor
LVNNDQAALLAAAHGDMALCTLVGIDGSFSRRVGAQIAIAGDGRTVGSLSDGCLERQLASDVAAARATADAASGGGNAAARVMRYGKGSPIIDFRLPCGSGLDILIDPAPDRAALVRATTRLEARQDGAVDLPLPAGTNAPLLARRRYIPTLRIILFGEGPEFTAFAALAGAAGAVVDARGRMDMDGTGLALGEVPTDLAVDPWTAILLLFHDHEWERALLRWAVDTPAFFIGAQGGGAARANRAAILAAEGVDADAIARIHSPIGLIPRARDPQVLALSVLAQIVGDYEKLHPHR